MAVGGFVCMYFNILQITHLRSTFFCYDIQNSQGGELIFKLCLSSECFCVKTGAENGSSSQGVVGQTGPVVSSTGGVSKTSKGQGSTEKEEQAGNQKRARRQWESWSAEDKNSFFEGLYEVKLATTFYQVKSLPCFDVVDSRLPSFVPSTGRILRPSRTTLQ